MRTLLATILLAAASVPAMAQAKLAVVNFDRAVAETAEFKKAAASIEAKFKPLQDQLAKEQTKLDDYSKQMQNAGSLSRAGQAELQSKGERQKTRVDRMQQDLQEEFTADRDAAVKLISTRLGDVVKKFAEDNQFDAILDADAVRYAKNALDVTDKVIAAYDTAHPAK
jgi:outer membrane protein